MQITIVAILCHGLAGIAAPVCREEIVTKDEMPMQACMLSQPALAEWKAASIYRSAFLVDQPRQMRAGRLRHQGSGMMGNIGLPTTRGEVLLDLIYDEVDQRLNPDGEECSHCGGEGATYDCIDGCCVDAESGCSDCERPCLECKLYAGRRARAVREEVIKANDVDVAAAWLKSIKRWRDGITEDQIRAELVAAAEKLASERPQ